MASLQRFLIPAETPVIVTRRHWASMAKSGTGSTVLMVLGLLVLGKGSGNQVVGWFGLLLFFGALGWFSWIWIEWRHGRLIVTDRRVLLIYGLITRRVGIMPLSKVTDLTYERTLPGRLLGYGAFVLESAGQHQAFNRVDFLPAPDRLYQEVSVLLFRDRGDHGRPSTEQVTAPLPDHRWRPR